MKTAMQELQEWMSENHFKVTFAFLDQLEYCKQKEKEQIRNAYNDGYFAAYKYKDWEEYYKQTYNQNK